RMGRHRAEHIASADGIDWIDDTKATNPEAARASLTAAERIVWIAGGDTKGADLEPLIASAADSLVGVVLLGTDASPFTAALTRHAPQIPVIRLDPGDTDDGAGRTRLMEEAGRSARSLASPGAGVLLAPAAATIDPVRDAADRGDLFGAAGDPPQRHGDPASQLGIATPRRPRLPHRRRRPPRRGAAAGQRRHPHQGRGGRLAGVPRAGLLRADREDRKSTRLTSSHVSIPY